MEWVLVVVARDRQLLAMLVKISCPLKPFCHERWIVGLYHSLGNRKVVNIPWPVGSRVHRSVWLNSASLAGQSEMAKTGTEAPETDI